MKKLILLSLILLFLCSYVSAVCINSPDDYSVGVLLNKNSIDVNTKILDNTKNINHFGKKYILQSSSSPEIALVVEPTVVPFYGTPATSVRLQIPLNMTIKNMPYIEFSTTLHNKNMTPFTNTDWVEYCSENSCEFSKNAITITSTSVGNGDYLVDIEIKGNYSSAGTFCGGRSLYTNAGIFCINKEDRESIDGLLKSKNLIRVFEELFLSYKIEGYGTKRTSYFTLELSDDFFKNLSSSLGVDITSNKLEDLPWDKIMKNELEWLKFNDIVRITGQDIKDISSLSKLGYAGENRRIFYGQDYTDNYKWLYYFQDKSSQLSKIRNCQGIDKIDIPREKIYMTSSSKNIFSLYFLIPILFAIVLFGVLAVLIIIARRKIAKEERKLRKK